MVFWENELKHILGLDNQSGHISEGPLKSLQLIINAAGPPLSKQLSVKPISEVLQ